MGKSLKRWIVLTSALRTSAGCTATAPVNRCDCLYTFRAFLCRRTSWFRIIDLYDVRTETIHFLLAKKHKSRDFRTAGSISGSNPMCVFVKLAFSEAFYYTYIVCLNFVSCLLKVGTFSLSTRVLAVQVTSSNTSWQVFSGFLSHTRPQVQIRSQTEFKVFLQCALVQRTRVHQSIICSTQCRQ